MAAFWNIMEILDTLLASQLAGTHGAAFWGRATVRIKGEKTANLCPYFFQQHTVSEYTAKIDQVIVAYVQFAQVRVELQCVRERPEVVLANV